MQLCQTVKTTLSNCNRNQPNFSSESVSNTKFLKITAVQYHLCFNQFVYDTSCHEENEKTNFQKHKIANCALSDENNILPLLFHVGMKTHHDITVIITNICGPTQENLPTYVSNGKIIDNYRYRRYR